MKELGYRVRIEVYTRKVSSEQRDSLSSLLETTEKPKKNLCKLRDSAIFYIHPVTRYIDNLHENNHFIINKDLVCIVIITKIPHNFSENL